MLEYVLIGSAIFGFALAGGALAYYVYRNPIKLVGLGTALFRSVWPHLKAAVLKRMTPEEEAKWREEYLRGNNPIPKGTGVTTGKTIVQPAKTKKTGRDR